MSNKTYLITGGAGFIGSNFIINKLSLSDNDNVICVDSLTYAGNIETLKPVMDNDKFTFIRTDICNKESIESIFLECQPDVVINFAAESHVDRSIKDPQLFLKTNIIGTSVLMDACVKHNVERFHQVSTDEVYGDLPLDRPDLKFTENTPLHTSSPYSSSKAGADLLVMAYERTYGLPVSISRCSNNYGPNQFPEKLIPLMITKSLLNQPLPIYGDGLNVRDWLYVKDHCTAIEIIVKRGKNGCIYNIGGNNEVPNIEIVKTILNELNKPESLITFVEDRKGHDRRYAIDSSKIQRELGWRPETSFKNGIKSTINWYCTNKNWSDRILNGSYIESNNRIAFR